MEKIAFLFPGQGSQYAGMSKSLYDQFDLARQTFEEASDNLRFDLAKLCFEGSLADLGKTENALVAIFTASVVSFRVYMKEIGITPQFCAGHSLGEFSALTCSGALRFSDAVKMVYLRAKLAQETANAGNGAMTIIDGLAAGIVAEECARISQANCLASVACYNSPSQTAISGHLEAVQKVEDRVLELGGQVTPLIGNPPFHCPVMQPAADQFQKELQKCTFSYLRYPVMANVTGLPYEGPEKVVDHLIAHMVRPVQWHSIMNYFLKQGITLTIELGPKNVLSNLIKLNVEGLNTLCFDQPEDRKAVADFFFSREFYKKRIPNVVTKCLAIATATPNRNFNSDEYQKGVVEPYQRILSMQKELEEKAKDPGVDQMREALKMLRLVFQTKQVPLAEQREWFGQITDETGTTYLFQDMMESIKA
jgi:[acyl-carrier-protein] S-malonyltransferase